MAGTTFPFEFPAQFTTSPQYTATPGAGVVGWWAEVVALHPKTTLFPMETLYPSEPEE